MNLTKSDKLPLGCYGESVPAIWKGLIDEWLKWHRRTNSSVSECELGRSSDGELWLCCLNAKTPKRETVGKVIRESIECAATGFNIRSIAEAKSRLSLKLMLHHPVWCPSNCRYELHDMQVTLGELCCLYDLVMKRPLGKVKSAYGEEVFTKIYGEPINPFISIQRDALLKQFTDLAEEERRVSRECTQEREKAREAFDLLWKVKRAERMKGVRERQEALWAALKKVGVSDVSFSYNDGKLSWN